MGLEVGYVNKAFRDQPLKRPPFPGLGLEHLRGSTSPGILTFNTQHLSSHLSLSQEVGLLMSP